MKWYEIRSELSILLHSDCRLFAQLPVPLCQHYTHRRAPSTNNGRPNDGGLHYRRHSVPNRTELLVLELVLVTHRNPRTDIFLCCPLGASRRLAASGGFLFVASLTYTELGFEPAAFASPHRERTCSQQLANCKLNRNLISATLELLRSRVATHRPLEPWGYPQPAAAPRRCPWRSSSDVLLALDQGPRGRRVASIIMG